MRSRTPVHVVAFTAALAASSAAFAQERGTIVGVVRDTTGRPIENAQVSLGSNDRRALTTADGRFRFDKLGNNSYTVSARRIGFQPQRRVVRLLDTGAVADFTLVPLARTLPTIVTAVPRGGLSGIVEDSVHTPIPNARVEVFGSRHQTTTDSAGSFFVAVHPGRYVLSVSRRGFADRLVGVTVPRDSGRHVLVGLLYASKGASTRQAVATFELRGRLMQATGPTSMRLFTREDLDKLGNKRVEDLASFAAVRPVDPSCLASVNGEDQRQLPLWLLETADVELIEIYPTFKKVTNTKGQKTSGMGPTGCPSIIAWMRR